MHCAIGGSSPGTTFGPPDPTTSGIQERLDEKREPVGIDPRIGIGVRDDRAARGVEADVTSGAQSAIRDVNHSRARVRAGNLARLVARAVVHDEDFEVGVRQPIERRQAILDGVGGVVRTDDDRNAGPRGTTLGGKRCVREHVRNRRRRRFGSPRGIDQAEGPVVHREAAAPPFVGPGERDRARCAFFERGTDVHRGERSLSLGAFANAVHARFGEEERLVSRDVLQAHEVRAQLRLTVQVHVERADIEKRKVQEFGRRIVDVSEQAPGRRVLRRAVEASQEAFDAQASVPADDGWWNLVSQREHQDGGVITKRAHLRDDLRLDALAKRAIVQECDVL